ncbi:MAG TPA: TAT-variant-translocated molybdopterin oxidoreductase [Stellaceae bacterium]|jgi:molybdopterin-containing oxidoreductase family iron-sulfur binding subunit|nr:TAT-variant-translocated molybdopterin oxidoreductase [Stellaceae bacterium]
MTERYWWRSFEERAEDPAFLAAAAREFPRLETALTDGVDRRRFLRLMAAAAALAGITGRPLAAAAEDIVPRVDQVSGEVAGVASYVATATIREGYATGAILQHRMGRPVKLEGNPDHPASLGASDAMMQGAVLDLYDPQRSTAVMSGDRIRGWPPLLLALAQKRADWSRDHGRGLRLLTGRVTSPSLAAQIAALLKQYPEARWYQWEPLSRDQAAAGATLAFGRAVDTVPMFDHADVVLGIESDAIAGAPGHLAFARAFAARRRAAETGEGRMSRVYALETTPTLMGAMADHRFVLKPAEIEIALRAIAAATDAGPAMWRDGAQAPWVDAVAHDLKAHRGAAVVHAGAEQPAVIHALTHAINAALGAPGRTVRYLAPVAAAGEPASDIAALAADMHAGKVGTLLILDSNPVYDAPADLGFAEGLARVPLSIHLGLHRDETAARTSFHTPALHAFETWGDARAFDGTATILQPQIKALVDGRGAADMIALLAGTADSEARKMVADHWRATVTGDFDAAWTGWLRKGVIDGTAAPDAVVAPRADFATRLPKPAAAPGGMILLFRPDPFLRAGAHANNAWLQELPRPLTRLTWDNAALIAPATAARLKLQTEDVVEVSAAGHAARLPAMILPGQAEDCITLSLGYGRRMPDSLADRVGVDVYPLRRGMTSLWQVPAAQLRNTGDRQTLAMTQHHQTMDGRDIVRVEPLDAFLKHPPDHEPAPPSLYPRFRYDGTAWGMAISLNSCIGCGACVAACQAENNIPTVGREEVMRGREMHWIRIDRYWGGAPEQPETLFQPVPCMHCEEAPCEVVCPVGATVHDHDGLNVMVYNRCVGTRFCSNNCPYKVRRFNFFDFAGKDERPAMSWNPEVTVRSRGVMEKCTYCIQRIRETKIAADRDDRAIRDGEIKTACQQACPAEAIVFGDLNDPKSAVRARKISPLDYSLLDELNTRPRTTYAARLKNRNPEIADG